MALLETNVCVRAIVSEHECARHKSVPSKQEKQIEKNEKCRS